jgi:hypothetical protein
MSPPPDAAASSEAFEKIGEFIFWFSQVELVVREVLSEILYLPPEVVFVGPITASYDFRVLCDVTVAACRSRCTDPGAVADFQKLISACKKLNDDRVRIVHGTWVTRPPWAEDKGRAMAIHMSQQSLKTAIHFTKPHALAELVHKCIDLHGKLHSVCERLSACTTPPARRAREAWVAPNGERLDVLGGIREGR